MKHRYVKTGWHLLLVVAAMSEYMMAETNFRRLLAGGCVGYHLAAAHIDWMDKEGR